MTLFFYWRKQRKTSCRNSGRSMLNQSTEVLRICVSFQESRDSIKEEPENKVYDVFIILKEILKQFML